MFGLGFQEVVVIAILAVLLLGPKKIPELAQMLGKLLKDFQKAADDVKHELTTPVEDAKRELAGPINKLKREVAESMEQAAWTEKVQGGLPYKEPAASCEEIKIVEGSKEAGKAESAVPEPVQDPGATSKNDLPAPTSTREPPDPDKLAG